VQVLNSDDVFCRAMKRAGREVKWFSLEHEADFWLERETGRLKQGDEDLIATQDIPLQGLHNAANVMAAVALCEAVGLPREALLEHVKTFQGLPHRVEKIGEKNGVVFIDDSKGTNVGATAAAIAGLQNPLFVILGGMGKGQDFTPLRDALAGKAKGVFLIGVDAPQIRRDLDEIKVANAQESLEKMDEVLSGKHGAARDIVLLNAAAALYAGNVVPSLADGVQAAEEAIDSGKAKAKKEEFIRFTQQFAKE